MSEPSFCRSSFCQQLAEPCLCSRAHQRQITLEVATLVDRRLMLEDDTIAIEGNGGRPFHRIADHPRQGGMRTEHTEEAGPQSSLHSWSGTARTTCW